MYGRALVTKMRRFIGNSVARSGGELYRKPGPLEWDGFRNVSESGQAYNEATAPERSHHAPLPMRVEQFKDPYLNRTWGELGVRALSSGHRVSATLGYPAAGMAGTLADDLAGFLDAPQIDLDLNFKAPSGRGFGQVKHLIAVASGKGGVGKSTTAVNLALALAREGAAVGLLDADIYGPSQGMMLGVASGKRPQVKDEKFFVPIKAWGLKAMSMSFLVDENTPMVWRGPMATGALQQLLGQTDWGALDYLVVDMPAGHWRHSANPVPKSAGQRRGDRHYPSGHRPARCSQGDRDVPQG